MTFTELNVVTVSSTCRLKSRHSRSTGALRDIVKWCHAESVSHCRCQNCMTDFILLKNHCLCSDMFILFWIGKLVTNRSDAVAHVALGQMSCENNILSNSITAKLVNTKM